MTPDFVSKKLLAGILYLYLLMFDATLGFSTMMEGGDKQQPLRRSKRVRREKNLSRRSSSLGEESDADHFQREASFRHEIPHQLSSTPLFSIGLIADIQYVSPLRVVLRVMNGTYGSHLTLTDQIVLFAETQGMLPFQMAIHILECLDTIDTHWMQLVMRPGTLKSKKSAWWSIWGAYYLDTNPCK